MKLTGFFYNLLAALFGKSKKAPTRVELLQTRGELLKDKRCIAAAQLAGNSRLREAHRVACIGGYRAKMTKVQAGKGNHSTCGIPQRFLLAYGLDQ